MAGRRLPGTHDMPSTLRRSIALAQDLVARGRFGEARARLQKALKDYPDNLELRFLIGRVLHLAGRSQEAESHFQTVLSVAPGMLAAVVGLAQVWRQLGKTKEAAILLMRCLTQVPDNDALIAETAGLAHVERHFDRAITLNRRLLTVLPNSATAHANIAEALSELRREEEALPYIEEAARRNPLSDQLRLNRALALLTIGRFRDGWQAYEARLAPGLADSPKRLLDIPRWSGEAIMGKHILICSEQGLGDQFFFSAYLPQLAQRVERMTIETDPRLVTLFRRSFPNISVHPHTRRLSGRRPVFSYGWLKRDQDRPDLYIDLASLPYVLGDDHALPVAPKGYLEPDAALVEAWRGWAREISGGLPLIGIFWRSGLITAAREQFYPTIERWGPVLNLPGIRFLSLQFDDDSQDLKTAAELFGIDILKPADIDLRNDLDRTAALYRALSGVIAPSTTTATMAAAVGTRTIVVNRARDWVPTIDGRDAILNATERVHPPCHDDWEWVFNETRRRLETWLSTRDE